MKMATAPMIVQCAPGGMKLSRLPVLDPRKLRSEGSTAS